MKKILVTGATGYLGSHTCVALAEAGYDPVALDRDARRSQGVLRRMQVLMGRPLVFEQINLLDVKALRDVLRRHEPDAVVHLAGDEVMRNTGRIIARRGRAELLEQYIWSGFCLVQAMEDAGCRRLVAASSDTVYRQPVYRPLHEGSASTKTHPLGLAHLALEDLYQSIQKAEPSWKVGVLRLFEVVGAHRSLLLGPPVAGGSPNWLMELAHVAAGLLPHACVRGMDYPTADGSLVRDYVHVDDVAQSVIAALRALEVYAEGFVVNIGRGEGLTHTDTLAAFEAVCRRRLLYRYTSARSEDAPHSVADPSLAKHLLGWYPQRDLHAMCLDTWEWHEAYLRQGSEPAHTLTSSLTAIDSRVSS